MSAKKFVVVLTVCLSVSFALFASLVLGGVFSSPPDTVITNRVVYVEGNLTSKANVLIVNSTLIAQKPNTYFSFTNGNITLINSVFSGFGGRAILNVLGSTSRLTLNNVTFTKIAGATKIQSLKNAYLHDLAFPNVTANIVPLILNGLANSVLDGLTYNMKTLYTVKSAVAISVEGCQNLTLSKIVGIGLRNVNTPHFHVCLSGSSNYQIIVSDSVFFGGGNGGVTGSIVWRNCTFDSNTDGTEVRKFGDTRFYDCVWQNITGSEINLQSGMEASFIRCTFYKGAIDLDNGTAYVTNCTFPNGMVTYDGGDNNGAYERAGVLYQFWNYSGFCLGIRTTWDENFGILLKPDFSYDNFTVSFIFNDNGAVFMLKDATP